MKTASEALRAVVEAFVWMVGDGEPLWELVVIQPRSPESAAVGAEAEEVFVFCNHAAGATFLLEELPLGQWEGFAYYGGVCACGRAAIARVNDCPGGPSTVEVVVRWRSW